MMKQRSVRLVCSLLLVLAVGFLYAAAVRLFHIGIPCVFQEVTGLKCPGCGISGMCLALLRLDFKSAFLSNRLLFVLIPVFLFVFARMGYHYVKTGSKQLKTPEKQITAVILVLLLVFGAVRNLPAFGW